MSSPRTCHRDKSTAIPSIFLTCLNRRVRALQLQRNVSFNCVGVAVFQPRASAWVQRVCVGVVVWCGEAGMTEQALAPLLFTYRDYLALAGWWTAVWLEGGERVNKHKTSFTESPVFTQSGSVLVFKLSCICVVVCTVCRLVSLSICVCLSLYRTGSDQCASPGICAC